MSLYIYTHLQIYTTSVYILALSQKCYNNIVYFWQYKLSRGGVRPTVHGMSLSASEWLLVLHSLWQPGNGAKPHFGRDRKFCHWVGGVFWSSRYHSTKCATILKKKYFPNDRSVNYTYVLSGTGMFKTGFCNALPLGKLEPFWIFVTIRLSCFWELFRSSWAWFT